MNINRFNFETSFKKKKEVKKILYSDHTYEIGGDNPIGYYLFCSETEKHQGNVLPTTDASFNMYKTYPRFSSYNRERGYFGVVEVTLEQKYIRLESGSAIYYGNQPFNLYKDLSLANPADDNYHRKGIIVMSNELSNIKVYKRDKNKYVYYGDADAIISEQFIYSINEHYFWAGFLNVETFKNYDFVEFGLKDSSTGKQYKFGDKNLDLQGITGVICSVEDDLLRPYYDEGKIFYSIELPTTMSLDSIIIEWVQPSCSRKKLYLQTEDNKTNHDKDFEKLSVVLQEYRNTGLDIDIKKELKYFEQAPDLVQKCSTFLEKNLKIKSSFDDKVGDDGKKITFHVGAKYDKRFYCAAKLADNACDVQVNAESTVYYVTFSGSQIEEIDLMLYDLGNSFNYERDYIIEASAYLRDYDFFNYLENTINDFICDLRAIYGYSGIVTQSVLVSINKAIRRNKRVKLNKLYTAMVKEERVIAKWNTEYRLFDLVNKFVEDAAYQYRTEWLVQQSFDIFIPSQNIAIEYQGKQHYEAVEVFGGQEGFANNQERDKRKRRLSIEHGVKVLDWKYDILVNKENVQLFLFENSIEYSMPIEKDISSNIGVGERAIEMAPVKIEKLSQKGKKEQIV